MSDKSVFRRMISKIFNPVFVGLLFAIPFIVAGVIGDVGNCPVFARACYMYACVAFFAAGIFFSDRA